MNGQSDYETRTFGVFGVECDSASQLFCELAAQRQSETNTFLKGVELHEALEDVFRLLGGYAASCVFAPAVVWSDLPGAVTPPSQGWVPSFWPNCI